MRYARREARSRWLAWLLVAGGIGLSCNTAPAQNPFSADVHSATHPAVVAPAPSGGGGVAPAVAEKPFSIFTPPSAISPYANMYRPRSSSGIDNYNLYVRPLMDQQNVNQRTQTSLESINSVSRQQGSALNSLQQRTGTAIHQLEQRTVREGGFSGTQAAAIPPSTLSLRPDLHSGPTQSGGTNPFAAGLHTATHSGLGQSAARSGGGGGGSQMNYSGHFMNYQRFFPSKGK